MGAQGVSRAWFLREACHVHWAAIAAELGVAPSEFRDRSGARVIASVAACSVRGDAAQLREGDSCQCFLIQPPDARNGWHSLFELRNETGQTLRAEILTSFARRKGPSNRSLEPAELEGRLAPHRKAPQARRGAVLRGLGEAERLIAGQDRGAPHRTVEIDPTRHLNGVALVCFAEIHDMFASTERRMMPDLFETWALAERRVHFFGNLDAGDSLRITCRGSSQSMLTDAFVVVQSHAKRASDGAVIATAESVYGG